MLSIDVILSFSLILVSFCVYTRWRRNVSFATAGQKGVKYFTS